MTLPLAWRRRAPLPSSRLRVRLTVQRVLGGGLFVGDPPPPGALLAGAIAFYSVGATRRTARRRPACIAGVAGLWTDVFASVQIDVQSFLFSAGLSASHLGWRAARTARALRTEALERERDQRERAAAARSARGSRASSTTSSPTASVLMVAAGAGRARMLDRDPERAREALEAIEETGRRAGRDAALLGVLRDDRRDAPLAPQPGLDDLDALVDQLRDGRAAGRRCGSRASRRRCPPGSTSPPTGSCRRR